MKNTTRALLLAAITFMPMLANADWRHSGNWRGHRGYHHNYRPFYPAPTRELRPAFGRSSNFFGERAIWDGVRSGRLSDREVASLRKDAWNIRDEKARYSADGVLTRRERDDLRNDIGAFHDDLNHELNDGERRRY